MPEQVTFDIQHNTGNTRLPGWTIRVYPIDPGNANVVPAWMAAITPHGVTMQTNGITDHFAWSALLSARFSAGDSP